MANTKYILEQIKIAGQFEELIAKSNGENVAVVYNEESMSLSQALGKIFTSVSGAQNEEQVKALIKAEVDKLINGADGMYDTLGEIAAWITEHKEFADGLNEAIGKKADKQDFDTVKATVEALGDLARKNTVAEDDLSPELKTKLNAAAEGNHSHDNKEALDEITQGKIQAWDAKADKTEASGEAAGLMPAADKKRLDAMGGVFYGTQPPAEMRDGDLFIHVVSEG